MNDDIAKAAYVKTVDDNLALWHEKTWSDPTPFELEVEKADGQSDEQVTPIVSETVVVTSEVSRNSGRPGMGISIAIIPPK